MHSNFPVTGRNNRVDGGEVKIGEIMFYAILENGGKQYKAIEGNTLEIDLLPDEVGKKKTFEKILLLVNDTDTKVGSPFVEGASVDCTVVEHFKGEKVTIFKYRPKQRYRVKTGHRQSYTKLMVDSIAFPGKAKTEKKEEPVKEKTASSSRKAHNSKPSPSVKKVTEKSTSKKAVEKKVETTKKIVKTKTAKK